MLPELAENKQEISAKSLASAGHALLLLPAGKSLSELPGGAALRDALKRRGMKPDALAKTPVTLQLPGGTLATYAMLAPETDAFAAHEQIRKALAPLLAEHPRSLALAVFGEAAFKAWAAAAAVYVALVNGVPLPAQKSKADPAVKRVAVHGHASKGSLDRVRAVAEGNVLCRALTALPPNALTPAAYRKRIRALAKEYGWAVEELPYAKLKKMGAGAFCAVAQGSPVKDAAIVRLSYRGAASKMTRPLALVGKGICFDTGGHNLKPARYMQRMNEDMNGSAVVLGILAAVSRMKRPVNIDAWLAIAENHIGPDAYRPSEVVKALNGTTIEVVHTDAEGRMALADALALAAREKPAQIVDFATLTGSMHVAVGVRMSGIFATDSTLAHQASRAGAQSGERVVAFPAPADYDSALDSDVADIKQCTLDGEADHILATRFLSRFVGDTPWIHVDLAAHICKGGLGAVASDTNGFGVAWGMALLDRLAS
ncbi:leucyl aminopeptidase family protein [Betaproteobacteria bacterium SCN1]|jgi:leucyl aminopeptidase|nr:leucyl aminopeptidase family protein [Betaproteobacteria bacterium SCN1]